MNLEKRSIRGAITLVLGVAENKNEMGRKHSKGIRTRDIREASGKRTPYFHQKEERDGKKQRP